MPAERLSMRKIREVLRLQQLGLSQRQIARSAGISPSTVCDYSGRLNVARLTWAQAEEMEDGALERLLFADPAKTSVARPAPDWAWVHGEMRKKHVTLMLLWEEYRAQHPDGYQYSQFCERYRRFEKRLSPWMRQEHRAGERAEVDWSGDGIPYVDPATGEVREARLFVGVLCASNLTYAEATETEKLPEWIGCHVGMYEYFGGVPEVTTPDQPKVGVTKACRYDPELNPTYREMAEYYETCVIPARPRKPRDKAKAEVHVLIAQRWIIARLRNRTLVGIAEVRAAVRELLELLNNRPQRKLKKSRRELFEEVERAALKPLPEKRYEYAERKAARVNLDYHVEYETNQYSVPYKLIHEEVELRAASTTVEVFHEHRRVCTHLRNYGQHQKITTPDHMPSAHRAHAEWTPSRIVAWATKMGPNTALLVQRIMDERRHPEHGFRACIGIIRLAARYTEARLERSCERAVATRSHSYRSVESILKKNLDLLPLPEDVQGSLPLHENLRGSSYFN